MTKFTKELNKMLSVYILYMFLMLRKIRNYMDTRTRSQHSYLINNEIIDVSTMGHMSHMSCLYAFNDS